MTMHNADNERIQRRYFAYLKEAKRHSEPTVDAVAKALDRFEVDTYSKLLPFASRGRSLLTVNLPVLNILSGAPLRELHGQFPEVPIDGRPRFVKRSMSGGQKVKI